jgi:hypothetical protein
VVHILGQPALAVLKQEQGSVQEAIAVLLQKQQQDLVAQQDAVRILGQIALEDSNLELGHAPDLIALHTKKQILDVAVKRFMGHGVLVLAVIRIGL